MKNSNYSTLKSTYKNEQKLENLRTMPLGVYGLISHNDPTTAVLNQTNKPAGDVLGCNNFDGRWDPWSPHGVVVNTPQDYWHDATGSAGSLNCKSERNSTGELITTITCNNGDSHCCADDGGLSVLVPGNFNMKGIVRPDQIGVNPQCVVGASAPGSPGFKADITKRTCPKSGDPQGCPDTSNCTIDDANPDCKYTTQALCKSDTDPTGHRVNVSCLDGGWNQGAYVGIEDDCSCYDNGKCYLKGTKCCNGCYESDEPGSYGYKFCRPCSEPPPDPPPTDVFWAGPCDAQYAPGTWPDQIPTKGQAACTAAKPGSTYLDYLNCGIDWHPSTYWRAKYKCGTFH